MPSPKSLDVKIGGFAALWYSICCRSCSQFVARLLPRLILRRHALVLSDSRKMRTLPDHRMFDLLLVGRMSDAIPLLLTPKDTLWIHR